MTQADFTALHTLRVKGFANTESLSECCGMDVANLGLALEAARDDGLVDYRTGRIEGWRLTPEGRDAHGKLLAEELSGLADAVDQLRALYEEFSDVNGEFKAVCTVRQLRDESTVNDHTDAAYDAAVIARLQEVHDRVTPICERLAGAVERLGNYAPRLAAALDRVCAGDTDAFAKPLAGSYHDVWMELHEDLIVTLDLQRTAADA